MAITSEAGLVDYEFMPTTAETVSITTPLGTASTITPVSLDAPVSLSGGDYSVDESFDAINLGNRLG